MGLASENALWNAVWPFRRRTLKGRSWAFCCALTVFPFTAILHHAVFYPSQCVLNPFGPEYDAATIARFLSRDPSLPWAVVACLSLWTLGSKRPRVRQAVAPVFFALLPLTVYLWDIPFSGRAVCRSIHDGRPISGDFYLRTIYFYAWGAATYSAAQVYVRLRSGEGELPEDSPTG